MARYIGPNCKLCRREGQKLFLKGLRCYSDKCAFNRRPTPPGQHGTTRKRKVTDYCIQLREKQKVKRSYGLLERQFKTYFEKALKIKGITGTNLLVLLERRLDTVVYRMGFAPSIKAARQLILHQHITVNSRVTNIPSFLVKIGDRLEVREQDKQMEMIQSAMKLSARRKELPWLEVNKPQLVGTFIAYPTREEIPLQANEQLIVELYSK
ncbi:MAG: 30S ribosomal protein S4 [Candidatus Delongbacteria bacterium]|nr:30S ribosomal protein S4 [Candidatus Delongbacteria bacterium]